MHRLRTAWALLGLVLLILGLPTIGDGVAGWVEWLGWLREGNWQLVFLIVGVGLIVVAEGPAVLRHLRPALASQGGLASTSPAAADAQVPPATELAREPEAQTAPRLEPAEPPLRDAVWAEQTRERRLELLREARVDRVADFRRAFDTFVDTFFAWRRSYGTAK